MLYPYKKYFLEGKKQALQILPDKKIIDQLEKIDPTKTNKYIELFAKLIKNKKAKIEDLKKLSKDIEKAENKNIKIDVTKIKTLKDLSDAILQQAQKLTKGTKKKGVSGLTINKDYFDAGIVEDKYGVDYYAYIPLHWEASKVIGSNRVGSCEGKWCTAYQKDESYWTTYVKKDKNVFMYLIKVSPEKNNDDKLALQFNKAGKLLRVWDANDSSNLPSNYFD